MRWGRFLCTDDVEWVGILSPAPRVAHDMTRERQTMTNTRREFIHATGLCAAALAAGQTVQGEEPVAAKETTSDGRADSPEVAWSRSVPVRYTCDVAVVGGAPTSNSYDY